MLEKREKQADKNMRNLEIGLKIYPGRKPAKHAERKLLMSQYECGVIRNARKLLEDNFSEVINGNGKKKKRRGFRR